MQQLIWVFKVCQSTHWWFSVEKGLYKKNCLGAQWESHLTEMVILSDHNTFKISFEKLEKNTGKPVLSGDSKVDKTKILKTDGSLMQVESIAECSKRAFCNTFDLH